MSAIAVIATVLAALLAAAGVAILILPRRRRAGPAHRVVVIGGGFGGLQAARKLGRARVDVTLIDRRNFHLFSPLLYQVATGSLSAGEIAVPLRAIFKRRRSVRVLLGEVTEIDVGARRVHVAGHAVRYDTLIVAAGSRYAYFGHDEWREHAPAVKTLGGALDVRRRVLGAFEAAELDRDPAWLTFVVVGAGPTGVELAGQIAEIARDTLRDDFRAVDTAAARVLLVEHHDAVLPSFPPSLQQRAERALRRLGVTPRLGSGVVDVDAGGVEIEGPGGERERIDARTVLWAAGVEASPLALALAAQTGATLDRAGRIGVNADLTLPGHPEILAVGDMAKVADRAYPGVSPVAMQQGRHAARVVLARLRGRPAKPFRYLDKGNVATIGRRRAVVDLRGLRLSGAPAWLFWLGLHLYYLVGFQNRLLVLIRWTFGFLTRGRGARLIVAPDSPTLERSPA